MNDRTLTSDEVVDKSWQELAREAQLEREEFRCKVIEQAAEIERLQKSVDILNAANRFLSEQLESERRTPETPEPQPMPFKDWAADIRTVSMQQTIHAYKDKIRKLEYQLACRPSENAAPAETPERSEAGWLIELSIDNAAHWLTVSSAREWTIDSYLAIRFSREEDAERMLYFMGLEGAEATDHIWRAGPTHEELASQRGSQKAFSATEVKP